MAEISPPHSSELVFVIGKGHDSIEGDEFGIMRWDPVTREESLIGRFPMRPRAMLASLEDKLYLIGGLDSSKQPTKIVNSYCTSDAGLWEEGFLSVGRAYVTGACSLKEILVCGGWGGNGDQSLSSCEVFESTQNRWTSMPSLKMARSSCGVVWLPDGRVFVIGGYAGGGVYINSVEMTTREWSSEGAAAGVWRNVAGMLTARTVFAAVVVQGLVIVAGGYTTDQELLSTVELFTPPAASDPQAIGQWISMQPMPLPMWCLAGVTSGETVFVFDGESSKIQRFRPSVANTQWSASAGFANWIWDEEVSLKLLNNYNHPIVFK